MRVEKLKERLLNRCIEKFRSHCLLYEIADCEIYLNDKVWHHSFDPHT